MKNPFRYLACLVAVLVVAIGIFTVACETASTRDTIAAAKAAPAQAVTIPDFQVTRLTFSLDAALPAREAAVARVGPQLDTVTYAREVTSSKPPSNYKGRHEQPDFVPLL